MGLEKYFIGLVMFALLILIGSAVVTDLNATYDVTIDDADFAALNNNASAILNEIEGTSVDQSNRSLAGQINDENIEDSMFKGSFQALRLVKGGYGLVNGIIFTLQDKFDIPPFIGYGIITIVTLFIAFSIIFIVFRIAKGA